MERADNRVRVIVHGPQRIKVKPGSYTGSPVGDLPIDHNGVFNCKPFATVTVDVPQIAETDPESLTPIAFGCDDGGFYMTADEVGNTVLLGRDNIGWYADGGETDE